MDTSIIEARLAAHQDELRRLARTIDHLTSTDPPGAPEEGGGGPEEIPSLAFAGLDEFVYGFVTTHYEKPAHSAGAIKWYPCWAGHPSVVWAMEILWGSFEEARAADIQGGGGSNSASWTINTFIPLMDWLTTPDGPFTLCGPKTCAGPGRLGQVADYPTGISA